MANQVDASQLKQLTQEAKEEYPIEDVFAHLGLEVGESEKNCPCCRKDSFFFKGGKWWGCMRPACDFERANWKKDRGVPRDAIGILMFAKDYDFQTASVEFLHLATKISDLERDQLLETITGKPKEKTPTPTKKKSKKKARTKSAKGESNIVSFTSDEIPPPGDDPEDDPLRGESVKPIFAALHQKIPLTTAHRTELTRKRGFSQETIDFMGYRSSISGNRKLIEGLRSDYTDEELIDQRVFKKNEEGMLFPESQLYGIGNTGRKDKEGEPIWEETNPVIIPYYNDQEDLFWLRPHKGGLKGRRGSLLEKDVATHVYGEHIIRKLKGRKTLVITEGEFKAAAVYQTGFACIAVPGIQMVNSRHIWNELTRLIHRYKFDNIVIVFDNEDKSDKEPEHQHDVIIWALVLARKLRFHAKSVKIGQLPTELREDGKVDFDGILARYVNELGQSAGTTKARTVFQETIRSARTEKQWLKIDELIPTRGQRIILTKVGRYSRSRRSPIGDKDENKLAWLFRRTKEHRDLAQAFESVADVFFIRKPVTKPERDDLEESLAENEVALKHAIADGDSNRTLDTIALEIEYCREKLKGIPTPIADFSMRCIHRIILEDGTFEYFVRAYIPGGNRVAYAVITPNHLSRAATFREFIMAHFAASYGTQKGGADKDIQDLAADMNAETEHMNIIRVSQYGYHEKSGYWFTLNAAYKPDGTIIKPDDQLVFWDDCFGYQIEDNLNAIGQHFSMGAPDLQVTPPEDFTASWTQYCNDMMGVVGGMDAFGAIGIILANYAMPDFFRNHTKAHPGLWMFGLLGGGKTQIARSLMAMMGFPDCQEFRITGDTTPVGMGRTLAQYSFLPPWFDEYRAEYVDPSRDAVFRGAFDRSAVAKGKMDQSNRTYKLAAHCTPMVSGETMSIDPATRSRYFHMQVSSRRRQADPGDERYLRMLASADWLPAVGHYILTHQQDFNEAFERNYQTFRDLSLQTPFKNKRIELVHGVAFAGFLAAAELLSAQSLVARSMEFFKYIHSFAQNAQGEIESGTIIAAFWEHLISSTRSGLVKSNNYKILWLKQNSTATWENSTATDDEAVEVIAINSADAFNQLMVDLGRQRITLPISKANLAQDLAREKYWLKRNPKDRKTESRMRINGHLCYGWLIRTDAFDQADLLKSAFSAEEPNAPADGIT